MTEFIFDMEQEKSTDLWTTEHLIDELFIDLANSDVEIKVLGINGVCKTIHYKKYYRQALNKMYRIPVWRPTPSFIVSISDLSEKVKKELCDYYKAGYKYMFNYIVTEAVGRLFENIDFNYYHQRLMKKLKVRFEK